MIYVQKIDSVLFDTYADFGRMLNEIGFDGGAGHGLDQENKTIMMDGVKYKYAESLSELLKPQSSLWSE